MTNSSNSNDGRNKFTRTDLINELKRLADDLDRTPTFKDMNDDGEYSAVLYYNRFGSWNNAVEAAGLAPNPQHPERYTDEELLEDLREYADRLGTQSPSSKKMNRDGPHSSRTYKERFDSWNNAVEEAGLTPNTPLDSVTNEDELLSDLAVLAEDLGRLPKQKEISEYLPYSHNTYYNHWGSIKDALEASDADLDSIDMTPSQRAPSIEREELLDELRRLAEELDRPPRWTDIRQHSKYSDSPYRSRFDSLDAAYREAGIQPE